MGNENNAPGQDQDGVSIKLIILWHDRRLGNVLVIVLINVVPSTETVEQIWTEAGSFTS